VDLKLSGHLEHFSISKASLASLDVLDNLESCIQAKSSGLSKTVSKRDKRDKSGVRQ
jgi:hypothetical protein